MAAPKEAYDLDKRLTNKISESGLDTKDARTLKYETITAQEAAASGYRKVPGIRLPYFDVHGNVTKFERVRYFQDLRSFAPLDQKYGQKPGSLNEVYLPPVGGINWAKIAKDPRVPIIITEGEFKAACGCKFGPMPTLGLGGVSCWCSKRRHLPMLPALEAFNWETRTVYIVYDSDAARKAAVRSAEFALANALLMRRATPHIVRLPDLPGEVKTGLDDFIVSQGASALRELLEAAQMYEAAEALLRLNATVVAVRTPEIVYELDGLRPMDPGKFVSYHYANDYFIDYIDTEEGPKAKKLQTAPTWLKWPGRREVSKATYRPAEDEITENGELNLWPGWGCSPQRGDVAPWHELLSHLFGAEKEFRRWFEQWLAYPLQHPGIKLKSAVLLWSPDQGVGKSMVGYTMKRIYGKNFVKFGNKQLRNDHNSWMANKQFALGEEVTSQEKFALAEELKEMITQEEVEINEKYIPQYYLPDCCNYLFTSNKCDAMFLDPQDRRYGVHQVQGAPLADTFYAKYLDEWLPGEGAAALFHYLLSVDLEGFNPNGRPPMTESKLEMINASRSELDTWLLKLRDTPEEVSSTAATYALWDAETLFSLYKNHDDNTRVKSGTFITRLKMVAGATRLCKGQAVRIPEVLGAQSKQVHLWSLRDHTNYAKLAPAQAAVAYLKERGLEAKSDKPTPARRKDGAAPKFTREGAKK